MRRLFASMAIASLLPLAAAAQEAAFDEAAVYAKAQEEGELTWYIGQFTNEQSEQIAALFTETYPGVQVNVIRASGAVVYSRLQQDIQAGVAQCDVFGATDLGHAVELKEAGQLQPIATANNDQLYPQFQNADPDGEFVITATQATMLAYNTRLLSEDEAPTSWKDLADPKWQDKLASAHPAYSGSMGTLASAWVLLHGEEYIQQLADLNMQVGRSMNDPVATVSLGERTVGTAAISSILVAQKAGNPLGYIVPEEGVLVSNFPSVIPAGAPHPNAAQLFVNFLQSEKLQGFIAEEFSYIPVNRNAPVPEGLPTADLLQAFDLSEDDISAGVLDAIEIWRDAFGA